MLLQRLSRFGRGALCSLGLLALVVPSAPCDADVISSSLLFRTLDATTQIHRKPPPDATISGRYYDVDGTDAGGYVSTDDLDYGYLRSGADLLIVPLVSGGSGGVFTALLYTSIHDRAKFIGTIPSPGGHLSAYIDEGRLHVSTPNYKTGDANCCPSSESNTIYDLVGTRLKQISQYTQMLRN